MEELVKKHTPCLSTELTELLIKKGVTSQTARKRVSRGSPGLKSLTALSFPKKAKFVYLQKDFGTPQYWEALEDAILKNSPSYSNGLASLIQRGGVMPKQHFLISCGSPLRQKKHISSDDILKRFISVGIITEINIPGIGDCIELTSAMQKNKSNHALLRARLISEQILLQAIKSWARKLNIVAYNSVMLRNEKTSPKIGTFEWDLAAPSYLSPLVKTGKAKLNPGFLACDVLLGFEISEEGIKPFLKKGATLKTLKNIAPYLQVFVADRYSELAFSNAKSAGIIPATPESLFGKDVAEALKHLITILEQTALDSSDPAKMTILFESLGKIEGAAISLRGALFEFIVAHLVEKNKSAIIRMNQEYTDKDGNSAEADVVAIEHKKVITFIECKGYSHRGTVSDDEIEKWIKKRVPTLRSIALDHPDWKNYHLNFELWSTGKVSDGAMTLIRSAESNTKRYSIKYRDSDYIKKYAIETKDKGLIHLLNNHFLKHD